MSSSIPALRLQDVRLRYGRVQALDGLCLEVRAGEIYGFLGRNGAGKTTTLRVLMGIVAADSGTIEVFGERVKRIPVALKRRIGYVSQEQTFYPWMTARQLGRFVGAFYPTWDDREFARLLDVLDIPPDQRSATLSGGTRAKLALALALAPRPDLLLLDEPTTGLDPVARREFNDLVVAVVAERGTTTLFSSHLVDEVQTVATRVGIIQAGRMRIEGEVGELLARVRRVVGVPREQWPPGVTVIRDDVAYAEEATWSSPAWPAGARFERLSLEDVFLAYARTDRLAAPAA
jgi:ABC-2 type transport system ATP-binding protein